MKGVLSAVACNLAFLAGLIVPADGSLSVINSMTHSHELVPGEAFEGRILIRNTGAEARSARVYQRDYAFFAGVGTRYEAPGTNLRSNASWLAVSPPEIEIPSGEVAAVYYQGRVPVGEGLEGTYWSMIMVEPMAPVAETRAGADNELALSVRTVMRYGVQAIVHIGDTGVRQLQLLERRLVREGDRVFLEIDVENTGNRLLSPVVSARVFSNDGTSYQPAQSPRLGVFPGCSVRHRLDLSDIPDGTYQALVILDNGDDHVFGARYDLEIRR